MITQRGPWKNNLLLTFSKRRGHVTSGRVTEEALDFGQEAEAGVERNTRAELYWGFHREGKAGGRANTSVLASLNNSGGLWNIGVVTSYLLPGTGLI